MFIVLITKSYDKSVWCNFSVHCLFNYPRFGRQTVFWGECLKIQKRQLTRNELVALNFIILGISLFNIS